MRLHLRVLSPQAIAVSDVEGVLWCWELCRWSTSDDLGGIGDGGNEFSRGSSDAQWIEVDSDGFWWTMGEQEATSE